MQLELLQLNSVPGSNCNGKSMKKAINSTPVAKLRRAARDAGMLLILVTPDVCVRT